MARAVDKAPQAFRTITEVSADIGIPPHVLRFWETKFTQLRPMTRPGGRRFYRTEDVALLKGLKGLLHEDGYTIKGVQKIFKEEGIAFVRNRGTQGPPEHAHIRTPLDQRDDGPLFAQLKRAVANDPGISVRLQQTLARLESARAKVKAVMAR